MTVLTALTLQVRMICERLLKQQEVRLRYEYETVLNQRLEGKCFSMLLKVTGN